MARGVVRWEPAASARPRAGVVPCPEAPAPPGCDAAQLRPRFRVGPLSVVLITAAILLAACGGDGAAVEDVSSDAPAAVATAAAVERDPVEPDQPGAVAAPAEAEAPAPVLDASEALLLPGEVRPADEFGWSGGVSGDWMVVGAPFHDQNGPQSGAAFVYQRVGEVWREAGRLLAFDGAENDWFARGVAIDGDTLLATSPFADQGPLRDTGAVYVFERDGEAWRQRTKLVAEPPLDGILFGWNADIDGDTMVVGANGNHAGQGGGAYIFRRGGDGWQQEAFLQPADSLANDDYGFSVAVQDGVVVVGAPNVSDVEADGRVYVYERDAAGWSEVARLVAAPSFAGGEFGSALALGDDVIAVGAFQAAPAGEDSGAVYLFGREGGGWASGPGERAADSLLLADDTIAGDWFGYALDIEGDRLAVGTPRRDHERLPIIGVGAAYVFERTDGVWTQTARLVADDADSANEDAGYGWDVWLDAAHLGVGAWSADNAAGIDAGSAYIYRLAGPLPGGAALAAPARTEAAPIAVGPTPVQLRPAFGGRDFLRAVDIVWLPDGRALVAEQGGTITLISPDGGEERTALDLRDAVASGGNEQGLLSLALDPAFADNGYLWIYYTAGPDGASRLSRLRLQDGIADAASELVVLEAPQFTGNHNGGAVRFGPDGLLYLGLGDGGGGGDPEANGQDLGTLLGSIIRLDVSAASAAAPYAIPADNPFRDRPGARPEIWAYGLRNPWRMAFDEASGLLWLGDVGQDAFEEINVAVAGGNYGWSRAEGVECFPARGSACDLRDIIEPVSLYSHDTGCAVIGGLVYRGGAIPGLAGAYIFGDLCSGQIWGLDVESDEPPFLVLGTEISISSFAADDRGGLYVLTPDRPIFQIVPVAKPATAAGPHYEVDSAGRASR